MTRVIVVANQKGGVGKTTSVANLGAALSQLGHKVLLIDLDPQAALTATFGLDPYNLNVSMYSVLMSDKMPLTRIIKPAGTSNMAIAPASIDLAAAEVQLARANQRARRLERPLRENTAPFDFILMDTPPSLGLLTLNALVAGSEVLVPVQCHFLAMRGVRALMETVWRVKKKLNPSLRLLGLLPTMYDADSRHSQEVLAELHKVFKNKVIDGPIETSVRFAEVPVAQTTLVDYDPDHPGSQSYRKAAEVIANHGQ